MRLLLLAVIVSAAAIDRPETASAAAQPATKTAAKDTPLAERTRTKFLKVKITAEFKDVMLREVLKEFAAQVDMQSERPVMWTYAEGVPAGTAVTYKCSNKTLEEVLEELCTKHKLGYFVISEDDHPRDGWVRITQGTERGMGSLAGTTPPPAPVDEDEAKAGTRLAVAKEQLEAGKKATGRAVLNGIIEKYPKTKAAAEAKALLEKLDK